MEGRLGNGNNSGRKWNAQGYSERKGTDGRGRGDEGKGEGVAEGKCVCGGGKGLWSRKGYGETWECVSSHVGTMKLP